MPIRQTFVIREGKLIEVKKKPPARIHHIQPDIPMYFSPVTNQPIDGRTQRREDLIRHGCRETDPSEIKYINQPRDERQKRLNDFVDNKINNYLNEKWG